MDDELAKLLMAADALDLGADGSIAAVARNRFEGREAAFALRIRGGLQPSRVGDAVNPLAHVEADAVVLSSLGEATEHFVEAAAAALGQELPPRSRWKRMFEKERAGGEARFAALLVTREGDASDPKRLHLKLFCDGGELYLDVDLAERRIAIVEKDAEFRAAVWRSLHALVGAA